MSLIALKCRNSFDLHPACQQVQQKLPWFLESQPSMACAKGGAGAYTDAIEVCLGAGMHALMTWDIM